MNLAVLRQKTFDGLTVLALAAVTLGLIRYPVQMTAAAREGLEMCFNVLIPSLFPFFVVSNLTVELGLADRLGGLLSPVMEPLFNVGGQCAPALILGLVGGYPVGARTVINLYTAGKCSRAEAERLLAFCNNSGPAFILGVVGAGIFSSSSLGLALYLIHVVSSLLVGACFRSYGTSPARPRRAPAEHPSDTSPAPRPSGAPRGGRAQALVGSVTGAFSGSMGICGFVIFFSVLLRLLLQSGVMAGLSAGLGTVFEFAGLDPDMASRFLTGLLELTSGVWSLRDAGPLTARAALAAFMLGWAGLSVHCQVLSFVSSTGLRVRSYLLGKLLHGLLSAGLAAVIVPLVPVKTPVSSFLLGRLDALAAMDFASCLKTSAVLAAAVLMIFLISGPIREKTSGKNQRDGV